MCGEHCGEHSASFGVLGSSPHVRGAHGIHPQNLPTLGIIPACAGSTIAFTVVITAARDHPRMCGEHSSGRHELCNGSGSSPHVRGARRFYSSRWQAMGIIPACAGSTYRIVIYRRDRRDHPRMCGEHSLSPYTSRIGAGSSPHVRGARRIECECDWIIGIIPACAGSTLTLAVSKNRARDHPRMCGEHIVWPSSLTMAGGSSPHVRGARSNGSGKTLCMGIIPACAGSTSSVSSSPRPMRDHPRMCGEHQRKNALHGARHGSSPHVRGALCAAMISLCIFGIIPACAGSTADT